MTWIDNTKLELRKKYWISPVIIENYQTRYKRFHHRAAFRFEVKGKSEMPRGIWDRRDWQSSNEVARSLRQALGDEVKIRNEWSETFVYFNDLDGLIKALPRRYRNNLVRLELMLSDAIEAKQKFTHDYPVTLTVKKHLPYNRYRYRVYLVTSSKVRRSIGTDNLTAICSALTAYDGLKLDSRFMFYAPRAGYAPNVYFYAETLDWLPLIYMMEPRYIKRIEQFATTEEIKNNEHTA